MAKAERPINLADRVMVVGTGKSKFIGKDVELSVQKDLADEFVKKGYVTSKK